MLELELIEHAVNYAAFPWLAVAVGVSALAGLSSASKANKTAARGQAMSARQAAEALAFQKEQAALLEKQKDVYRKMEFVNPYEGMQNVYEDLKVNTQAAEFQAEQGAQARANILSSLRGVAGASGIAALAQSLAGQGTLQARQISVDIARRGGEAMIQEAEMQRQSTLLGIAQAGSAGANAAVQQANANQMSSNMAASQMQMQQAGMFMNVATTAATTFGS